ncbi:MAG: P1 family peptidase [Hyphomicrobiales bacterium]|nr:P1 family peptidase [Hyphomicrobiales bacterium]
MLNLITDLEGVRVGNAYDAEVATGVTVILFDGPTVASGVVRGGAPGSRDTALLEPEMTREAIDAVVLSGGSLFGLDAAGGVVSCLRDQGVGFRIGPVNIPIAVEAITFDLLNGGNKAWGQKPPYWELGWLATTAAEAGPFALGTVGGGYGATTATLKGGLGSASMRTASGFTVGAIAVVNAVGTATIGGRPHFWAAPCEVGNEFGGLGMPGTLGPDDLRLRMKGGAPPPPSTTIGLVACDAVLTKAQTKRIAIMADDGLARAVRPAHAPMDGDTVFSVATQRRPLRAGYELQELTEIGMAAGDCLARAIARGVYEARALPFAGALPSWRDRFARPSP